MSEQLEKFRIIVAKEAGLVECDAFGHLVRLGVVSWEMLGEMSDEEWKAVQVGLPQWPQWSRWHKFDPLLFDPLLFGRGHMDSMTSLREGAKVSAAARERERKRERGRGRGRDREGEGGRGRVVSCCYRVG